MDIDWGKILMDPIVQGAIITASGAIVIAVIGGFIKIICSDINEKKYFEFMKVKLGARKTSSLEEQHDDIKDIIVDKTNNLKVLNTNEFNRIYTKVDSIDKEIGINKERTASLNLDQRIIRSNVEKLVYDWEKVNSDNQFLKGQLEEKNQRIKQLEDKNKELVEKLSKSKRNEKDLEL